MDREDFGFGSVTRDLQDITNVLENLSYQQDQEKDPNKKKKQDLPPKKNQGGYSWEQLGKDLLDGTSCNWQRLEQRTALGTGSLTRCGR